jgi:hypothetical protein
MECRYIAEIRAFLGYYTASCCNCLATFWANVSVPSSRVKSPSRKERKPATCNVDSIWKVHGVAISRLDDSQYGRTRVRGGGGDRDNVKVLGAPRMRSAKTAGKYVYEIE